MSKKPLLTEDVIHTSDAYIPDVSPSNTTSVVTENLAPLDVQIHTTDRIDLTTTERLTYVGLSSRIAALNVHSGFKGRRTDSVLNLINSVQTCEDDRTILVGSKGQSTSSSVLWSCNGAIDVKKCIEHNNTYVDAEEKVRILEYESSDATAETRTLAQAELQKVKENLPLGIHSRHYPVLEVLPVTSTIISTRRTTPLPYENTTDMKRDISRRLRWYSLVHSPRWMGLMLGCSIILLLLGC